jgi:predicted secreted protein
MLETAYLRMGRRSAFDEGGVSGVVPSRPAAPCRKAFLISFILTPALLSAYSLFNANPSP